VNNGLNSMLLGALAVGISIVIVLGGILLALAEGGQTTSITAFPTLESISSSTPTTQPTAQNTPTEIPTRIPTVVPTATASPSPTMTPTVELAGSETVESAACDYPQDWTAYIVKPGDTLNKISAAAGIDPQQLADANCLVESRLEPGSTLYLPPIEPTAPPVSCGPPSYWVIYIVQPGDTLFNIAQRVSSTVSQLKYANCLTSDVIRSGQKLFVPYQPAPLATPTSPPATTQPPVPTEPPIPTATPTEFIIPTPPYPYPVP
jgi:LysM repeat protein